MQALQRILWRSTDESQIGFLYVDGDNAEGVNLAGTPVIVSRRHGIAIGMFVDNGSVAGMVASSVTTRSYITAWRAVQLLSSVGTVRHFEGRFYSTLDRLMIAAAGNRNDNLLRSLAADFNCLWSDDFLDMLEEDGTWPSSNDLIDVWGLLSDREQWDLIPVLRAGMVDGTFDASSALVDRIDAAERQMKTSQHMGRRALQAASSR